MMHTYNYCISHINDVGIVEDVREALVAVTGLDGASIGEGVVFENGLHGMIASLGQMRCDVLVFSRASLEAGMRAARTGIPLSISVGDAILGRTITATGHLLSGAYDKSKKSEQRAIDIAPSGISGRAKILQFLETGVAIVDLVVPLGMGQRELIIGDRTTGKTHFLLQTVLTQAHRGTVCVYVAIGKRQTEIKAIEEFFRHHDIFEQSVIVEASAYDSPGEVYIAPYTGMTIAEYFRDQGRDVLIVLDDLTTHAKYYREFSLVLGSFPGRESYPGDIFHQHARLLERAGCFRANKKDTTITCLPVVDSIGGDMTGYIQTNVMSMTDGHIFFDESMMAAGVRPAINVFLSVTRVGRQTQPALFRDIGKSLLTALKSYDDAQRYLRFGPELTETIKETLDRGKAIALLFTQTSFVSYPVELLVILISFVWTGVWNGEEAEKIVTKYIKNNGIQKNITQIIKTSKSLEELISNVKKEKTLMTYLLK